jgi:DNA-binding transcriptional MerR regulator
MSYRIKSVAALTGVAATTLRAWERRYDLVTPRRTESGYRVYSEEDVAILAQVKALVDRGYKVGEAVEMVRRGTPALPPSDVASDELDSIRAALLEPLLEMDRAGALQVYDRLAALPFDRQMDEVLLPLLREVGDRWQRGEVGVAQEHFCTAFARGRLITMLESLAVGARRGSEAVCAGAPGEAHELGLMAVAIHLAMRGWRVTYLGADVPVEELEPLLTRRRPQLLCCSLILTRPRDQVLQLARALRDASPRETTVVLGGAGVPDGAPSCPWPNTYLVPDISDLVRLTEAQMAS